MLVTPLLLACGSPPDAPEVAASPPSVGLVAYAAASLTDVLPGVAEAWRAESGHAVRFSFESSSKLAKAVESGQPADLFFSADLDWMEHLAERGLVVSESRRNLVGNALAAVVGAEGTFAPTGAGDLAGDRVTHLAVAGENVPAGRYARDALRSLGVWDAVEARVVSGDDVRTALAWVAGGEAEAGIVYATDAATEPRVRIAFTFPADSHPPIVYPAAVLTSSEHPSEARYFLDFCEGDLARARFEDAGFLRAPARAESR